MYGLRSEEDQESSGKERTERRQGMPFPPSESLQLILRTIVHRSNILAPQSEMNRNPRSDGRRGRLAWNFDAVDILQQIDPRNTLNWQDLRREPPILIPFGGLYDSTAISMDVKVAHLIASCRNKDLLRTRCCRHKRAITIFNTLRHGGRNGVEAIKAAV